MHGLTGSWVRQEVSSPEECTDLEEATVLVRDGDGSVIAEGTTSSVRGPSGWEYDDACMVDFALEIPARELYRFEVAGTVSTAFTIDELREEAFHIDLFEYE